MCRCLHWKHPYLIRRTQFLGCPNVMLQQVHQKGLMLVLSRPLFHSQKVESQCLRHSGVPTFGTRSSHRLHFIHLRAGGDYIVLVLLASIPLSRKAYKTKTDYIKHYSSSRMNRKCIHRPMPVMCEKRQES